MARWQLSRGGGGALPDDNVPGEPVGSPAAVSGRRSIPTQRTCLHRPSGARSAWVTTPGTLASWRLTGLPAAPLASACWPVRSKDHNADRRNPPDETIAEWCGPSVPGSERPASAWLLGERLHRSVREPAAALTVGVVVLVPPNLLSFFFENQQGRGLCQSLVFAPEFLL